MSIVWQLKRVVPSTPSIVVCNRNRWMYYLQNVFSFLIYLYWVLRPAWNIRPLKIYELNRGSYLWVNNVCYNFCFCFTYGEGVWRDPVFVYVVNVIKFRNRMIKHSVGTTVLWTHNICMLSHDRVNRGFYYYYAVIFLIGCSRC